ncbi:MAG: hypothetical protein GWN58_53940 [Anaerolineae bacterium]|nr:hypothetical protein [Anaerolineae bacterium]
MEHGTLPVIENGRNIGIGYIVRDVDYPGDDVLRINDDYDVPVNQTDVVHVINFSDVTMPNEYWRIE